MQYDFSKPVNREGTDSVKYDTTILGEKAKDVLPLWIADMDFCSPPEVTAALQQIVARGLFGYSACNAAYPEAICGWMHRRHNWLVEPQWLVKISGVLAAISVAVQAFTNEGDAVMIQPPVHRPFSEKVLGNRRRLICNPLKEEALSYTMDFADLEKKLAEERVKLFILCNPHNPVGRVWKTEELQRLGELCVKYDVLILSDEVHCDFTFGGVHHTVLAALDPRFAQRTITCTAPGKTFNISGLQIANLFIPNEQLRKTFTAQMEAMGAGKLSQLGTESCRIAYTQCEDWHTQLLCYLEENLTYAANFINDRIPNVHTHLPEGGYPMWLDFRDLALSDDALELFLLRDAKLWLNRGDSFGPGGSGFMRLNPALPRERLTLALTRLEQAVLAISH